MKNRHLKKAGTPLPKRDFSKIKRKEERISQGVSKTFVFEDCDGNVFIPYCTYNHTGTIGKKRLEEKDCPNCEYYRVFVLDKKYSEKPYTCLGLDSPLNI